MPVDEDGDSGVPEMHFSCLIAMANDHLPKMSDAKRLSYTTTRKSRRTALPMYKML